VGETRFRWPLRIRFSDTDASGRIHYTATLRHFEAAEFEFMRHIGAPYQDIERGGISFPRVHIECDYLAAMTYDDEVEIEVSVDKIGERSYTLAFEVFKQERPAARGKIVIAAMDRQAGRSCPLPERLVRLLQPYLKGAQTCAN